MYRAARRWPKDHAYDWALLPKRAIDGDDVSSAQRLRSADKLAYG